MTDREVLNMLRGSPNGTTEAMLDLHGVSRAQRDRLVRKHLARISTYTLVKPPMEVTTYFATGETS
jgi:hypothetical protein